jgi:predicted phosphodiesterase
MKFLVFSDSHLSTQYDAKFLNWVKYWSKKVDKIIICGDLGDSYFCTLEEFVNSQWKEELFPILKSKDTIYIYGNHDRKQIDDEKAEAFCNIKAEKYKIKIGERTFQFEHGDRFFRSVDTKIRWLGRVGGFLQTKLSQILGKTYLKIFSKQTKSVRNEWKDQEDFLVCGHIHCPYIGPNYCILGPGNSKYMLALIVDNGNLIPIQGYEEIKER